MNKFNTREEIEGTVLFKQVSSVIGDEEAENQLWLAYDTYPHHSGEDIFEWDRKLLSAFSWRYTTQGYEYWSSIYDKLEWRG